MNQIEMTNKTLLLLIDLQNAIEHPSWGRRNNLDAESNIRTLLDLWRNQGWPVCHIRHDSTDTLSHYRPGQSGNNFRTAFAPKANELIISKTTNSAFVGTPLEDVLRQNAIKQVVVVGVITNNSVEATVRMGGNLGFDILLVADGCYTFDRKDLNGKLWRAEDVHALSLANLDGEYCRVVTTDDIIKSCSL